MTRRRKKVLKSREEAKSGNKKMKNFDIIFVKSKIRSISRPKASPKDAICTVQHVVRVLVH